MVLLSVLIARNLMLALRFSDNRRWWLVLAGCLVLPLCNLATSPLYDVEGLLVYFMLCGATSYLAEAQTNRAGIWRGLVEGFPPPIRPRLPGKLGAFGTVGKDAPPATPQ